MKVKISKTINLSQLPNEIRSMLQQIKNNLIYGLPEEMNKIVVNSLSSRGEEFFQTVETIDSFRQELAGFDESLQEVQNILVGYKQAIMPESDSERKEEHDEEWLAREVAETEKRQAQQMDVDEVEDEEG